MVGKSKTVQMIAANFMSRGVGTILVKETYTGIAASTIDGKILHFIAVSPLNGAKQSRTIKTLELYWHHKHYLIIDEIPMVSRDMFTKLSDISGRERVGQLFSYEEPLGELNVILVGDFHQCPQVSTSGIRNVLTLYIPCNPAEDSTLAMFGRKLYERFDIVV